LNPKYLNLKNIGSKYEPKRKERKRSKKKEKEINNNTITNISL
jgi:hypothetical protein